MSQFVSIGNQTLEYVHTVVDGDRPTLIFLHEGLGCIQTWRDFPEVVATALGCNWLVYNRAGYGASSLAKVPRQVEYLHDEALIVLPSLIQKLGIGRYFFIGHSDGGSIALINGGGSQSADLLGIITLAAHVFNEEACIRGIEQANIAYKTTRLRSSLAKYHTDVDHTYWGWSDIWLHPDFWHWNIEAFLPNIKVPTLVMQGKNDQYGSIAQVEAIKTGIGKLATSYLISNCRHAPHLEQPAAATSAIVEFVNNCILDANLS